MSRDMSIRIAHGDICDAFQNVIIHQVNCQGRMGAGVAKALASKWPKVREEYLRVCKGKSPEELLGAVNFVKVSPDNDHSNFQYVANAFAQLDYRKKNDVGKKCYTDYCAFYKCMKTITNEFPRGCSFAAPFGIGCGLAGGDWNLVRYILEDTFYTYDLTLYDIDNSFKN